MTGKSLNERLPEHIDRRIHQDIGRASMCWERVEGFRREEAMKVARELCDFIADELEKAKAPT